MSPDVLKSWTFRHKTGWLLNVCAICHAMYRRYLVDIPVCTCCKSVITQWPHFQYIWSRSQRSIKIICPRFSKKTTIYFGSRSEWCMCMRSTCIPVVICHGTAAFSGWRVTSRYRPLARVGTLMTICSVRPSQHLFNEDEWEEGQTRRRPAGG